MSKLDIETELNGPQIEAVRAIEGPVLIIAGAGSGKTRVITFRIAHMLEKGIPQSSILALTFTNKAAREMESRVKELTGRKLTQLTVHTFHAFGLKILREEIEILGYRKNFSIYDESDKIQLIKDSLRDCRISPEGVDLYKLSQIFSNIKEGRLRWSNTSGTVPVADSVWEPVYREYQDSLKIFNALDFDDLIIIPIMLFEEHGEILRKYRQRYRYIMVDEFQDTSGTQYRMMKLLADNNICVVGDDDQSIYSWRGASYENIMNFEKDFPGALEIKLEQNYRSTTTILEAANGVIANNTNRKEKKLWSGNDGGNAIELMTPENETEEASIIAGEIRTLKLQENLRYSDFGVLLRTNSLMRTIEEAFLAEDIPYKVSGGTSFFQWKEIKDILSYLRVIANPDDDVNLLRIINTPRRGIGKASVERISALAKKNHSSIWDAMVRVRHAVNAGEGQELFQGEDLPERSAESGKHDIGDFVSLIEFYRDEILGRRSPLNEKWTLSKKVHSLIDKINYWGHLLSEYSKNEKVARWKYTNLEYLIQLIERWEQNPDNLDPGLYAYLNRISLITRDDGETENSGKVNLMTIHAAKGLEFPVVFIAGAEQGIIPHERSLESPAENGKAGDHSPPEDGEENREVNPLEEERRLFYVAITRARDKLFISSCRRRRRLRDVVDCVPSPFIAEIPEGLVTEHQEEKVVDNPETAQNYFALLRRRLAETAGDC
ncbi:MAG: UvrD-helicase domain-containing protein [Treponema sp.]|jgi:DNA helicase-2/ATP-dependent DNA helicase PcrA|nr:UvrD-helicase domain-containing protein [Treponema sp.]